MSTPVGATRSPSTGRGSPATPGPSPTASSSPRCRGSPTSSAASGSRRGDRVAVYMPMIPELTVAMLACTRIGAVHSVVFGGFSSDALRDRILDAQAAVVVTADGGWRRGAPVALKANVDVAVSESPCVDHVVVARRIGDALRRPGADHGGRPRPLVARPCERRGRRRRRPPRRRVRAGAHGRRGPAVHPLHVGDHRRPQGNHAHHRGLSHPGGLHPPGGVRPPSRRRRLLVRGRHRLGDRAQLHRLRAPGQRGHLGDVRGHPGLPRPGPVVVDRRALQGEHPVLPPPPPSAPS